MLHTEHFGKADATYEIRHDNNDNAIHVLIKDGEACVFPSLYDLVQYQFFGRQVERIYCLEKELSKYYESGIYDFYNFKKLITANK